MSVLFPRFSGVCVGASLGGARGRRQATPLRKSKPDHRAFSVFNQIPSLPRARAASLLKGMISHPRPFKRSALAVAALVIATGLSAQPPAQKAPPPTPPAPVITPPEPFIPPGMFALPDDLEVTLW